MTYEPEQHIYDDIKKICIEGYKGSLSPIELMEKAWEDESFPMHCPEHHFLVPAVL